MTIPVLDHLETKIISPVLNLCMQPIGALSEVMMTMTTLMTDLIPHHCFPNQLMINKSSFILKELTDENSSIHCCGNECSPSSNILRKTPTSNFYGTEATTVVNLLDDDDDNVLTENKQEDMALSSTFLQEWDAFYTEFVNSTTYALMHSSNDSMPSPILDDDDQMMNDQQPLTTSSFDDSL